MYMLIGEIGSLMPLSGFHDKVMLTLSNELGSVSAFSFLNVLRLFRLIFCIFFLNSC